MGLLFRSKIIQETQCLCIRLAIFIATLYYLLKQYFGRKTVSHYKELQEKHVNSVVMQLAGNFYRAYGDSAKVLSGITGYKLIKSKEYGCRCGFPASSNSKIEDLFKRENVGYVFYHNEDQLSSYYGSEAKYTEWAKREYRIEKSEHKGDKSDKTSNITSNKDSDKRQGVSIISGCGISYEDALATIKTKLEEIIKNGKTIVSISIIDVSQQTENTEAKGIIVYKD